MYVPIISLCCLQIVQIADYDKGCCAFQDSENEKKENIKWEVSSQKRVKQQAREKYTLSRLPVTAGSPSVRLESLIRKKSFLSKGTTNKCSDSIPCFSIP